MKRKLALLFVCLTVAVPVLADEVWIPIVGTVGVFRTDARVFNASYDTPLTVNAYFYPRNTTTNAGVAPVVITIPPRTMRIFDDVVGSMFSDTRGLLGAIRLQSTGDIEATARIYATQTFAGLGTGTLGQFESGVDLSQARAKGALLQLKSASQLFRTNIGGVNPNASATTITFTLYDRNNLVVGTDREVVLSPFASFGPNELRGHFQTTAAANADLSDSWVSFEATQPVIVYGSVVDEVTTDQTFVAAVGDSGTAPPEPIVQVFRITASQWQYSPDRELRVRVGDRVQFEITSADVRHGFTMPPFVSNLVLSPGVMVKTPEFTVTAPGTINFACTETTCGEGHFEMNNRLTVDP